MPERGVPLEIGKGRVMREGEDVAILSFGAHLAEAREAVRELEAKGVSVTLADARFAKPLDTALVDAIMASHRALITVEQGAMLGFGGLVLHHLAATGQLDGRCAVRTLHLPDRFIDQASPADMYADAGLTAADIADAALQAHGHRDPARCDKQQGACLTQRALCQTETAPRMGRRFRLSDPDAQAGTEPKIDLA
jgi:1-deoxy-D-xylulose-5-phosphate synthase